MKQTIKAHASIKDAETSARKRSLFAGLNKREDRCYEVRKAPNGTYYSAWHVEFANTGWPVVSVFGDGYRD